MTISKRPGGIVVLMAWWVVPLFVIALIRYPRIEYFLSFTPFIAAFLIFGLIGFALHIWDQRSGFWSELGIWKKYFVLVGTYSLAALSTVVLVAALDIAGFARYFGGDAGGSFVLLFFPSIIFYIVTGAGVSILAKIDKRYE